MKPVQPLEWEPSKIGYLAWQEIHSRAHAIQDQVLAGGAVNLTQVQNLIKQQAPAVALNLDDGAQEELIIPYQTSQPAAQSSAQTPPVLNLDDSLQEDIPIGFSTPPAPASSSVTTLMLSFEDFMQDEIPVGFAALVPASAIAVSTPMLSLEDSGQEENLPGFPVQTFTANPSALVGLTAINGTALTRMTSDSAPALDQTILPTWTNKHIWQQSNAGNFIGTQVKNTSTGAAAYASAQISNSARDLNLIETSTGFVGAFLGGGPSGEQAIIYTGGNVPLVFGTNSVARGYVDGAGAWIMHSTIAADGSPLSATVTRAQTGLAGFRASDATSTNATLTADASLTLTFNETGSYTFEIWLAFWEATLGTGGFQFDLNSGSATVGTIVYGVDGFTTASVINAGVTSVATATAASSIATSSSAPSWFRAKGYMKITVAGTVAVRWAQNTISANATTLMAGAYFTATKIG